MCFFDTFVLRRVLALCLGQFLGQSPELSQLSLGLFLESFLGLFLVKSGGYLTLPTQSHVFVSLLDHTTPSLISPTPLSFDV